MRHKLMKFLRDNIDKIILGISIPIVLVLLINVLPSLLNPIPEIDGTWYCRTCTEKASLRDYERMTLGYDIELRKNNEGTFYKIYEDSVNKIECDLYGRSGRTKGKASKDIKNNLFRRDVIKLYLEEEKVNRTLSMTFNKRKGDMTGTFKSTISNQNGKALCQRKPFDSSRLCAMEPEYNYSDAKDCRS